MRTRKRTQKVGKCKSSLSRQRFLQPRLKGQWELAAGAGREMGSQGEKDRWLSWVGGGDGGGGVGFAAAELISASSQSNFGHKPD